MPQAVATDPFAYRPASVGGALSPNIATINPALADEGARLADAIRDRATIGGGCSGGDAPVRVAGGRATPDPRDPDHSRSGIFVYHNCWKCRSGEKACVRGNPNLCEYPVARND